MKKPVRLISFVAVLLCAALVHADRCRICGKHHVHTHVKTQVVKVPTPVLTPTNVYVVNNNQPAAPLVGQGNTGYAATGYQAAALPFLDPNLYFEQELQLQRAVATAAAQRSERTAALVERVVALQQPAAQTLARGTAAQAVLQAAGLANPEATGPSGVVVKRDATGKITVTPLPTETAAGVVGQSAPAAANRTYTLTQKYCGACHGTGNGNPGGGFYLGASPEVARVMRAEWFKITKRVSDGSMPPASSPQPTKEERVGILNELEQMVLGAE